VDILTLSKGANCEIPTELTRLRLVVSWSETDGPVEVDASALLLGSDARVRSDDDFVFFNQSTSPDGSTRHLARSENGDDDAHETIAINLGEVPDDVQTIAVTASIGEGTFGDLSGLSLRALDDVGSPFASFEIPGATTETAFLFGEVYRRGDVWKLRAVGQGWSTGLAGIASDFGVAIDTDSEEAQEDAGPSSDDDPATEPIEVDVVAAAEDDEEASAEVIEFPAAHLKSVPKDDPTPSPPVRRRAAGVRTTKRSAAPVAPPTLKLAGAETWQPARLFSVSGVGTADEQEKRATSALLSTMQAVPAFARALTGRFGAPAGSVETYLEVPFRVGEATVIPDGVIRVARGAKLWTALLEVKTGSGQLRRDQVEHYLDVARQEGYDVLVTLSNEIAPHAGEHPVLVDRRKLRKTSLEHISWAEVLHVAKMTLAHTGAGDTLQAWLLHELVRYLEHPRSGAATFDDMGPSWVPVREAIHAGTLRPSDRKVPAVADAWTRLIRQLCLRLSSDLGVNVTHVLPRKLANDSAARIQATVAGLAADGTLEAVVKVPLAAGPITVVADLRTSQVRVSTVVAAPETGTGQRRVSWLLKQLSDAPESLLVEAVFAGRSESACEQLVDVRANSSVLIPERGAEITTFRLSQTSPMGTKRSGVRGAFVPSVLSGFESFYGIVVQPLKPWVPAAPKLSDDVLNEATSEQADELRAEADDAS